MTMKSEQRGDHTHYWLECDAASCATKQPDVALSAEFCLTTAGQMGWRSDPDTKKDYCPNDVPRAENSIGHAVVTPDKITRG
jgi:hypothetical protein